MLSLVEQGEKKKDVEDKMSSIDGKHKENKKNKKKKRGYINAWSPPAGGNNKQNDTTLIL